MKTNLFLIAMAFSLTANFVWAADFSSAFRPKGSEGQNGYNSTERGSPLYWGNNPALARDPNHEVIDPFRGNLTPAQKQANLEAQARAKATVDRLRLKQRGGITPKAAGILGATAGVVGAGVMIYNSDTLLQIDTVESRCSNESEKCKGLMKALVDQENHQVNDIPLQGDASK
ncbi:MAG: hypothetical protein ACAH59_01675 [Pseudobdellovibrionaceae bacterium]